MLEGILGSTSRVEFSWSEQVEGVPTAASALVPGAVTPDSELPGASGVAPAAAALAAWVGTRVAVFFGAGDPARTAPVSAGRHSPLVLSQPLPCAPCVKNSCPLGTLACLADLDMGKAALQIRNYLEI